jgi:hypothetical protein
MESYYHDYNVTNGVEQNDKTNTIINRPLPTVYQTDQKLMMDS